MLHLCKFSKTLEYLKNKHLAIIFTVSSRDFIPKHLALLKKYVERGVVDGTVDSFA